MVDVTGPPPHVGGYTARNDQFVSELAAAKQSATKLYARWEELEAIKAASG